MYDPGEDRTGPVDVARSKSIELLRAAVNRKPVKLPVPDSEPESSSLREKIQAFLTLVQFLCSFRTYCSQPTPPRDPTVAEFYIWQSIPTVR
jgi:hypothetical protein